MHKQVEVPVKRIEALEVLVAHKAAAVSVTTMRAIPDWYEVGGAPDFNLDNRTCMGMSAALGLGIAIARPERPVMVIDGDGSLLMQLGGLASVAGAAPPNFYHFVLVNGVYDRNARRPARRDCRDPEADGAGVRRVESGAGRSAQAGACRPSARSGRAAASATRDLRQGRTDLAWMRRTR